MGSESTYAQVPTADGSDVARAKNTRCRRLLLWASAGWAPEILCASLGTLLMVTLCLVLQAYDGNPEPHFGSGIGSQLTLNTIVAIISASAKAALLLPVAECISQNKWYWFEDQYKDVRDMVTFDNASRGIYGGLELLWKTRLRLVPSLGTSTPC